MQTIFWRRNSWIALLQQLCKLLCKLHADTYFKVQSAFNSKLVFCLNCQLSECLHCLRKNLILIIQKIQANVFLLRQKLVNYWSPSKRYIPFPVCTCNIGVHGHDSPRFPYKWWGKQAACLLVVWAHQDHLCHVSLSPSETAMEFPQAHQWVFYLF